MIANEGVYEVALLMALQADPAALLVGAERGGGASTRVSARERLAAAYVGMRLEHVLEGHRGDVLSALFSPDGRRIVTASSDGTARVWDAATGETVAVLEGHQDTVYSPVFSPDGVHIVTGTQDGNARVWDAATGETLAFLEGHEPGRMFVDVSPDGARILTASGAFSDPAPRLWNAESGALIAKLEGHTGSIRSVTFSPDGSRIVTTSDRAQARVWDGATGAPLLDLEGHTQPVSSAAFSPDGRWILTASFDNTARIWDARSGEALAVLEGHGDFVQSASFSADGQWALTTSTDGTARTWDLRGIGGSGPFWAGLPIPIGVGSYGNAVFSPDQRRILASVRNDAVLFDAAGFSGQPSVTLAGHGAQVMSAAFSPDGERVVTASLDGTARVWIVTPHRPLAELQDRRVGIAAVGYSHDGTRIVTAPGFPSDGQAGIWDAATGALVTILDAPNVSSGRFASAAYSPDGRRVATTGWAAYLWDAATGELVTELDAAPGDIRSIAFSPDGSRIVAASGEGGPARLWDGDGKPIASLGEEGVAVRTAAFSSDGGRIVTAAADGAVRLWDSATGAPLSVLSGHDGIVISAAFSPDGRRIVTGSADKTARIWDAASGEELKILAAHDYAVVRADYAPDGGRILTISNEGAARLWDSTTGTLLAPLADARRTSVQLPEACEMSAAAFSPRSELIAGTCREGRVRLWSAVTGDVLATLGDGGGEVYAAVAFSPDGRRFVASGGGFAQIWEVPPIFLASPHEQVRMACQRLAEASAPRAFAAARALSYPVLRGQAVDPATNDFASPCESVSG